MTFRTALVPAVLMVIGLLACSKKEEAVETMDAAAPVDPQVEAQFVPPPAANPNADTVQERLNGAVHPHLTEMLHKFVEVRGRMPESLSELVNTTMDSLPPLPPGMTYAIDPADKSVKIVRQ